MASFRRASTTSVPSSSDNGNPYQIYTEALNTGKNMHGSKRKVCWRYGYSNSEFEHSVDFKASVVSGKKTVYHDGKEIISVEALFQSEFIHTWQRDGHNFRLECSMGLTSDHLFLLSINGIRFQDLPFKPKDGRHTTDGGTSTAPSKSSGFSSGAGSSNRRASVSSITADQRAAFQSPLNAKQKTISSDQKAFSFNSDDPFAAAAPAPIAKPSEALFASTDTKSPAPVASSNKTFGSPSPFGSDCAADPFAAPNSTGQDAFFASPGGVSVDPFGPSGSPEVAQTPQLNNSPFGNDVFSPSVVPAAPAPVNDVFDPFVPSPVAQPAPATTVPMDNFSNMTFAPTAAVSSTSVIDMFDAPANPAATPATPPAPVAKDPWSSLVNLDLNSSNAPPPVAPTSATRRQSVSLNGGNAMDGPINNRPTSMNFGNSADIMGMNNVGGSSSSVHMGQADMSMNNNAARRGSVNYSSAGCMPIGQPNAQQQPVLYSTTTKTSLDSLSWK